MGREPHRADNARPGLMVRRAAGVMGRVRRSDLGRVAAPLGQYAEFA
jgi:hypothetical protein